MSELMIYFCRMEGPTCRANPNTCRWGGGTASVPLGYIHTRRRWNIVSDIMLNPAQLCGILISCKSWAFSLSHDVSIECHSITAKAAWSLIIHLELHCLSPPCHTSTPRHTWSITKAILLWKVQGIDEVTLIKVWVVYNWNILSSMSQWFITEVYFLSNLWWLLNEVFFVSKPGWFLTEVSFSSKPRWFYNWSFSYQNLDV